MTEIDRDQVLLARDRGALCEIDNHLIESSHGTVFVGCPDGDQFNDVYEHHCMMCPGEIRHHPLLLNGGALLLSPSSPVPKAKWDGAVLMRHVQNATRIKGIHSVVFYAHVPCAVALQCSLDFLEVMRLLLEAKSHVRAFRLFSGLKFACFCHVDFGNGNGSNGHPKKRTYFVDREASIKLLRAHNRVLRA